MCPAVTLTVGFGCFGTTPGFETFKGSFCYNPKSKVPSLRCLTFGSNYLVYSMHVKWLVLPDFDGGNRRSPSCSR